MKKICNDPVFSFKLELFITFIASFLLKNVKNEFFNIAFNRYNSNIIKIHSFLD